MKTAKELIGFVKNKMGTNYVYGMKGAVMTKPQYEQLKKLYPSYVKATDEMKIGSVCVDCSGLISWCTGNVINSTSFKSTATKVLTIDKINQAVEGCAVWKQGHIGIYIGNGEIIEARNHLYGVVKTKVKDRDFTHILWLKDIDYSQATSNVETSNVYKVVLGDTLSGIAKKYNTTVEKLVEYNNIKDKNRIREGQVLVLSSNTSSSTSSNAATNYKAKVNAKSGLNIRKGPATSYAKAGSAIPYNKVLTITKESNGWGYTTYNGVSGWVYLNYITKG